MKVSLFTKFKRYCKIKKHRLSFPLSTKIHGVKNADRQGAIIQCLPEDELQLVHIPLPDFPYNTYVYSIPLNRILGYLETKLATALVDIFGCGFCLDGEIENTLGGPPLHYYGARIAIFTTQVMMEKHELEHLHE